jgi:hypothetical protein
LHSFAGFDIDSCHNAGHGASAYLGFVGVRRLGWTLRCREYKRLNTVDKRHGRRGSGFFGVVFDLVSFPVDDDAELQKLASSAFRLYSRPSYAS